jgi:hypothetical protein
MTGSAGRPQSSRSALADAYEKAVKSEAEKRAQSLAVRRKKVRTRALLLGIAWVIIAGCGISALLHPEWFDLGEVAETSGERDANLRLTLYIAGQQLAAYKKKNGVYPDRLSDAGHFAAGLAYVKNPEGGYILKLSRGAERVTLTSNDSLSAFLSPSLTRLVQRGGK